MAELFANSGDPDQMLPSAAFDLGLHCFPITLLRISRLQWINIGTPYLPIIFFLKYEQLHFYYLLMSLKTARWLTNNADPDQMPCIAASDLCLLYLLWPVCPNI